MQQVLEAVHAARADEDGVGVPVLGLACERVSRVAFHPKALVLAIGYEDGCILLVRLTDASELLARHPREGIGITALAWDDNGKRLAFGGQDGQAGVLTRPA